MGLINVSSVNVGLYSIVLGVLLAIIYDFFAVFINLLKGNNRAMFILDIIFMFLCSVFTYLYLIGANFGVFRAYVIFGELIGFALYRLSLGKLTVKLEQAVLIFIFKIYKKLFCDFIFAFAFKLFIKVKNYIAYSLKNILNLFFKNKTLNYNNKKRS